MPSASSVYLPCASGCGEPGCPYVVAIIEAANAAVTNLILADLFHVCDLLMESEHLGKASGIYIFIPTYS